MPLLTPLITHMPNSQQLYLSANTDVGVVDSVVAGTNISVNSANPKAPIVSAPNVQTKKTTFLQDLTQVFATPIGAGYTETNFGATFQVPATGLYIVAATYGVNVDAVNGATFGLIDDIGIGIKPSPPIVGVGASIVSFRPYTMPDTTSGGVDYGQEGTMVYSLQAGVNYQPFYWTDNASGTMAVPAAGLASRIVLVPLCT